MSVVLVSADTSGAYLCGSRASSSFATASNALTSSAALSPLSASFARLCTKFFILWPTHLVVRGGT